MKRNFLNVPFEEKNMTDFVKDDRLSILVFDDDRTTLALFDNLLSDSSNLNLVSNYTDFLSFLDSHDPDIFFIDIFLPEIDGLEVCRILRSHDRFHHKIIILITSSTTESILVQGYESGANDFIRKPFHPIELKSKVTHYHKVVNYQNELLAGYTYQLKFNQKLYDLNRFFNLSLNSRSINEIFSNLELLQNIIKAGYYNVIQYEENHYKSITSQSFDPDFHPIPISVLTSKINLVNAKSNKTSYYKIQYSSGNTVHVSVSNISNYRKDCCLIIAQSNDSFHEDDKKVFHLLIEYINLLLEKFFFQEEFERQNKYYRSELNKVRKIQVSLIPKLNIVPGFDIASTFLPAEDLSGDFFDGYYLNDSIFQVVLCDVSGHGVAASYVGNEIRTLFKTLSSPTLSPSALINKVNERLITDLVQMSYFGTVIVCQIDTILGKVWYCNGGHPSILFYNTSATDCHQYSDNGPLIGVFKNNVYKDIEISLQDGDSLLLYTDGVTEALSEDTGDMFGSERLVDIFVENHSATSLDILHSIVGSVYEYINYTSQEDDITMICIKRDPSVGKPPVESHQ